MKQAPKEVSLTRPSAKELKSEAEAVEVLTASDRIYQSMLREASKAVGGVE